MSLSKKMLNKFSTHVDAKWRHWLLFLAILGLGIFARTWQFGSLPPALNQDEASNGVDAYYLLHFGVDRNGVSYPVQFISWGSGQSALYGYMLIPFIAILGLRPTVVRLPMLLSGLLSIPLIYYVARKTLDRQFAYLAMFFLAISPWHILLSRWGLEANLFPLLFLAGYACLLTVNQNGKWFILASILFALCLYAYGTAYAMVPIFMICASIILLSAKALRLKSLIMGLIAFGVTSAPMALLVIVNVFHTGSINLGPVTIPRFPVVARFEGETIMGSIHPLQTIIVNLWHAIALLITQSDGLPYNIVAPFGYFYKITFPFAILGIILLVIKLRGKRQTEIELLLTWVGASISIPAIQFVNINRFNIIFIPLILCVAFCLYWLNGHFRFTFHVSILALLLGFVAFNFTYHGTAYRQKIGPLFHDGLLPALDFAQQVGNIPVCVDDDNMPYIFVLFSERPNPFDYLKDIKYVDPKAPIRPVLSLGRYTFGRHQCPQTPAPVYIFIAGSKPPKTKERYKVEFFNSYAVYYPADYQSIK